MLRWGVHRRMTNPMVTGLVLLVFYLILIMLYSPILGLLILSTTSINAIAVQLNLRRQKDASITIAKEQAKSSAVVVSAMREIETIKAAAIENDVFRRFAGYQSRLLNTLQTLQLRNARLRLVPSALTTANEVLVLVVGFLLVIRGELTLGMLLAAQTIAFSLKGQIEAVIDFVQQLPEFEAGVLRLEDVMEQMRDPMLSAKTSNGKEQQDRLSGAIEIRDLSFGFVAIKPPLIKSLNLSIQPGTRIALVGGSGSGKSTLAKLISGLHQPGSGEILFDGKPLLKIPRSVSDGSQPWCRQVNYSAAAFATT